MARDEHPIYEVEVAEAGSLFLMPAPPASKLETLAQRLSALTVDEVFCLVSHEELNALGLAAAKSQYAEHGIGFRHVPIDDFQTPRQNDGDEFADLISHLVQGLQKGQRFVVHCRAGIGRTGLVACCVLKSLGASSDEAIARVSRARGRKVPDNERQIAFIKTFDLT